MQPLSLLALLGMLILVPSGVAQGPPRAGLDWLGDPLPAGAIARLGTQRFKHQGPGSRLIKRLGFSPDGAIIASGTGQAFVPTIRLWNATTGKLISGPWDFAEQSCSAFAFSPDSAWLAVASIGDPKKGAKAAKGGKEISIWQISTGKLVQSFPAGDQLTQDMTFLNGGQTLVIVGKGLVRWWDLKAGKEQRSWQAPGKITGNCILAPNGRFLAAESQIGASAKSTVEITMFDLAKQAVSWRGSGARGGVNTGPRFAFSADSKWVAIDDFRSQLDVRDPATGKVIATSKSLGKKGEILRDPFTVFFGLTEAGSSFELPGRDNNMIALGARGEITATVTSDGRVELWEEQDSRVRGKLRGILLPSCGHAATALQFSPDGSRLAVAAVETVSIFNVQTLKEVMPLPGPGSDVHYLDFSADGRQVLVGDLQTQNVINHDWRWETTTWKPIPQRLAPLPRLPFTSGTIDYNRKVVAGKDAEKRWGLYDFATGRLLAQLTVPPDQEPSTSNWFSPDGKFFVLVGKNTEGQEVQFLYGIPTGKLLAILPRRGQPVDARRPLAFSADGKLVAATSGSDGKTHVIDTTTGKRKHILGDPPPKGNAAANTYNVRSNLAFSADGKWLASWSAADYVVRVWEMATGLEKKKMTYEKPKLGLIFLAFSPDGRNLAIGERKIQIWEVATLKLRHEFAAQDPALLRTITFSPNSRWLAAGYSDSTALIWELSPNN